MLVTGMRAAAPRDDLPPGLPGVLAGVTGLAAAAAAPTAPRTLHAICELTRLRPCGHCPALPHQPCVASIGGAEAYHLARFAAARARGLLSEADMAAVLAAADAVFTPATLVCDDTLGGTS